MSLTPTTNVTKRLGLIGSVSASDLDVYLKTIRLEGEKILGPGNSSEIVVHCLPTGLIRSILARGDWDSLSPMLMEAGSKLIQFGAEVLVFCGSALNPVAPHMRNRSTVPVVDICVSVDATIRSLKHRRVAVLGIRTELEREMWVNGLAGFELMYPNGADAVWLLERADAAIAGHTPLVEWKIETNRIVSDLRRNGAQVLVLAEPSLGRWIRPGDSVLYPIDAGEIHAWMAGIWAVRPLETAPPCIILP